MIPDYLRHMRGPWPRTLCSGVLRQRLPLLRMTIIGTSRGGATCTDCGNVMISGRL